MRICRFESKGAVQVGFYTDDAVLPVDAVARAYTDATGEKTSLPSSGDLIDFLPPDGAAAAEAGKLFAWAIDHRARLAGEAQISHSAVQLLTPIARPNKLFLLAGNYAKHIEEGGGVAAERAETFPYVFMKPPTTTLTNPGADVTIPAISPDAIDWELELVIVIGRRAKAVREADALGYVAGYTVINDISNRRFRPNPGRKERAKDAFFDWLHGKWHDSFCPCGPCIVAADSIADPQKLKMQLKVNGKMKQDASTAQQIFPVAAVVEFISNIVTLEPGDLISTGTPAGVGATTGDFLKPGDKIEASIESIGVLRSQFVAEA